jgi:hypothetical protein
LSKPLLLHKYAALTNSPSPTVTDTAGGRIIVSYYRMNKPEQISIPVTFEVRECSAFSKGKWIKDPNADVWTLAP